MSDEFAAFILTHGRADRVYTYAALKKYGYTGKIFLVVDDEDKSLGDYQRRYGDQVVVFSKKEWAEKTDGGHNDEDYRSVVYARNACPEIARSLGFRYFVELDDDYKAFSFRFNRNLEYVMWPIPDLDLVWGAVFKYLKQTRAVALAMSQGGDHIGGGSSSYNKKAVIAKRKAMNVYFLDTERPYTFVGKLNDDVNTYVLAAIRGEICLTLLQIMVSQQPTQSNAGGLTDIYLDSGTYVKSFYSVMYAPSCVQIAAMGDVYKRIHHEIDWRYAAPKIIREEHRKAQRGEGEVERGTHDKAENCDEGEAPGRATRAGRARRNGGGKARARPRAHAGDAPTG